LKDTRFFRQAELLLQLLPFFSGEDIFALKGGTAINFFIRDLPRLSVDIDLAYLPINDRKKAIGEILDPNFIDISQTYENEFRGMTTEDISLKDLIQTRTTLVGVIKEKLTTNERRFILSVKQRKPQWSLLGIEHTPDLPAVKWKMINLRQMDSSKHQKAAKRLQDLLGL